MEWVTFALAVAASIKEVWASVSNRGLGKMVSAAAAPHLLPTEGVALLSALRSLRQGRW